MFRTLFLVGSVFIVSSCERATQKPSTSTPTNSGGPREATAEPIESPVPVSKAPAEPPSFTSEPAPPENPSKEIPLAKTYPIAQLKGYLSTHRKFSAKGYNFFQDSQHGKMITIQNPGAYYYSATRPFGMVSNISRDTKTNEGDVYSVSPSYDDTERRRNLIEICRFLGFGPSDQNFDANGYSAKLIVTNEKTGMIRPYRNHRTMFTSNVWGMWQVLEVQEITCRANKPTDFRIDHFVSSEGQLLQDDPMYDSKITMEEFLAFNLAEMTSSKAVMFNGDGSVAFINPSIEIVSGTRHPFGLRDGFDEHASDEERALCRFFGLNKVVDVGTYFDQRKEFAGVRHKASEMQTLDTTGFALKTAAPWEVYGLVKHITCRL